VTAFGVAGTAESLDRTLQSKSDHVVKDADHEHGNLASSDIKLRKPCPAMPVLDALTSFQKRLQMPRLVRRGAVSCPLSAAMGIDKC